MEFEKNMPVSDEQRALAESKKITLQPMHTNVEPEDISDSETARSHINGQPIGNVHNDIEQEASLLYPAKKATREETPSTRKQSTLIFIISVSVAAILIALSLLAIPLLTS